MIKEKICIYCMGDYGLETYFKLKEKGVEIDYFADRDPEKKGYAMEGIYCRSYEELLCEDKKNCLLIVAVKNPEELIDQFKREGFRQVYDKETAVERLTNGTVGSKQTEAVRDIETIKEMKQNIQKAIYGDKQGVYGEPQNIISDYLLRHKYQKKSV